MLNHGLVKTVNWFIFGSVISNKNTKLVNHENICDTIKMSAIFVQVWINVEYSKYSIAMKYGGVEGPPHIFFRHHAISYG